MSPGFCVQGSKVKTLPILVVEDDRDLREALCDTLALSGYEALGVADGHAALTELERRTVGLVVTDVQMQPMDGHTLLREIKSAYPHLPVLLMTAYGMIDKAVEAMRAGACNYLTKPFEPDRLLAEVTRYMLPVKLLEYIGLGIPVIVSRTETIERYCTDDIVRFCEPGNVSDIAQAIEELYRHPERREAMVRNADAFRRSMSWQHEKAKYYALMESLA